MLPQPWQNGFRRFAICHGHGNVYGSGGKFCHGHRKSISKATFCHGHGKVVFIQERIAMAVALLDVTEEHCAGRLTVDEQVKATLLEHFHEYDIAGLASLLSKPLNSFYEDFTYEVKQGRDAFCRKAPEEARLTGYPVILAGEP